MDELLVKFGSNLRKIRISKKLSQEELAALASVHRTYIGMIERGEKNVTIKTIYKLSRSLNVPMCILLELEE